MDVKRSATSRQQTGGKWEEQTADGWFLGTSLEHYRAFRSFICTTRDRRVCDTVQFLHKHITRPPLTDGDVVAKAAHDLSAALGRKQNWLGDEQMRDLKRLSEIFSEIARMKAKEKEQKEKLASKETHPNLRAAQEKAIKQHSQMRTPTPRVEEAQAAPRVKETQAEPRVAQQGTTTMATQEAASRAHKDAASPPPELIVESGLKGLPKRLTKELQALRSTRDHEDAPPAKSTRSRSAGRGSTMARALCAAVAVTNCCVAPQKAAARTFPLQVFQHMANAVLDQETGEMLEYRQLIKHSRLKDTWNYSAANEYGRLAQGIGGRIKNPTNTIVFIRKEQVPKDRLKDTTYGKYVCNVRPQKVEQNRTRLTAGGDRINYPWEVGTPTADMILCKCLFNSVVSTPGARFMCIDISNFYLNSPLKRFEYMKLKVADIPDEVVEEYGLTEKATSDGHVYVEIRKTMYGLPHAGLMAQQLLEKRLNEADYFQSTLVPGLWKHKWRPITFTLVVDDFGVKYVGEEHARHLMSTLKEHYDIEDDWKGNKYIGLTLDWDYDRREVHVSMPGYIGKARKEFGHVAPARRQDSPYPVVPIKYGAKAQYAEPADESPLLDEKGKKFVQKVNGKFLYYGRAVDLTILPALSSIAAQQANPTEETMARVKQLLDYLASQEDAVLTYRASNMVLAVHSDASYLSERNGRSRVGGHFFLANDDPIPANNGAVLTVAQIIKYVMTSAAEAELGGLYINAREAVYIRQILEEMGHKQPRTPIQTDNSTAVGIINNNILPKATKAMDMRFHWLRCRWSQKMFRYYWRPGPTNLGDYPSKHHPGIHHRNVRPEFLTPTSLLAKFREKYQPKGELQMFSEGGGESE